MTADLAIVAMATVTALQVILDHRHRMKVADRERLVGPVKAQQPKGEPASRPDENERLSVLGGPSKGEVAA